MPKRKAVRPKAKNAPKADKMSASKAVVDVPMLRVPLTGAVAPAGTDGH